MAATDHDDGGTKMTTNGMLSDRILHNLLDISGVATCTMHERSLLLERLTQRSPTT